MTHVHDWVNITTPTDSAQTWICPGCDRRRIEDNGRDEPPPAELKADPLLMDRIIGYADNERPRRWWQR